MNSALLTQNAPPSSFPVPRPLPSCLTVSDQLQQSQVKLPFPAGVLVQGDAIARSGEHLTRADGHDLMEYIPTCEHMNPYTKVAHGNEK